LVKNQRDFACEARSEELVLSVGSFFQSGRKRSSFSRFFQSGRKRSFGFLPYAPFGFYPFGFLPFPKGELKTKGPLPAKLWFLPFWVKTQSFAGQRPKGKNPKLRRAFAFVPRSSFSRLELGREALVFNSPSAREHRRLASQREG
jgi:hypothetical protein